MTREEKRMPAEFFPLMLIFNRCVFSVSIMTMYLRTVPQVTREATQVIINTYRIAATSFVLSVLAPW